MRIQWRPLGCAAPSILVLAPLVAIFGYLVYKGIGSLNWAFLTQIPKPVGEAGGGMANAIVGSVLILYCQRVGFRLGIGAGIYLAEYGRNRFGDMVRFTADVLNGVPSIVIGIVGVRAGGAHAKTFLRVGRRRGPGHHDGSHHYSHHGRDAAAGADMRCGKRLTGWAFPLADTLSITLRTATSGVITGVMLAFARVAGETAPLLFTAFGNQFWT